MRENDNKRLLRKFMNAFSFRTTELIIKYKKDELGAQQNYTVFVILCFFFCSASHKKEVAHI